MESASSCGPQANSQPEPPRAQAPNPTGVILTSEFPSFRVSIQNLSINCAPSESTLGRIGFLTLGLDEHTAKWLERASAASRGKSSAQLAAKAASRELFRRQDFAPGDDRPEPFRQTTTAARQMKAGTGDNASYLIFEFY